MRAAVAVLALWLLGCATAELQIESRRAVRVCTAEPDVCWRLDGRRGGLLVEARLSW